MKPKYYIMCWYCDTEFTTKYPDQEICGACVPYIMLKPTPGDIVATKVAPKRVELHGFHTKAELEDLLAKKDEDDKHEELNRTIAEDSEPD